MALPLAGEPIGIQEKIEALAYVPGLQDTGDLEAATKTITATAEAAGVGNADYSQALTLPKPADARLIVKRIATRLAVTIDSMTAGHLYCRVYVDAQDAAHRLFDEDWTTTGARLDAVNTHSENLATIFALLKDGAAHTFYFFFWVDAGNAVISVCQLWEGVGNCSTSAAKVLSLTHQGFIGGKAYAVRVGTGSVGHIICSFDSGTSHPNIVGDAAEQVFPCAVVSNPVEQVYGPVATDLVYVSWIYLVLRSLL